MARVHYVEAFQQQQLASVAYYRQEQALIFFVKINNTDKRGG